MLGLTQETLLSALKRTDFELREARDMAEDIRGYYEVVGKPLDDAYGEFFYGD